MLAAVAASLAGCVGMPNSGSPGTFSATPQDTSQDSDFIGAVPAGPQSGWKPSDIVTGYLNATVSYPAYSAIAEEYLASPRSKNWAPNWSVTVVDQVIVSPEATYSADGKTATVDVSGAVQASFNGTGQYVGAQQGGHGTQTEEQFTLVKQGKQWRITDPPKNRMLTEPDFAQVYKPQDLYFFDSIGQVLVPDAVFVPTGTSSTSLATNLVTALLANPQPVWLQGQGNPTPPAITAFPPHSSAKDIDVTVDGTTATVNLTGVAASANSVARHQMAAQLVWTLTGPPGSPPGIQAVQLEFNGKPWTPGTPPCPGGEQGLTLKQAMYECKNPYPLATSSTFYYVANGQAWSRCASEAQVTTGTVGMVQPVFSRTGAVTLGHGCTSSVQATSAPVAAGSAAHRVPAVHGRGVAGRQVPGRGGTGREHRHRVGLRRHQAVQHPALVGRHRDQLGPPGLPVGGPWQHHHDDPADQQRQHQPCRDPQLLSLRRQDPRPEHRPGRRPGRRHRAHRLGFRGRARGHRQRQARARGHRQRQAQAGPVRPIRSSTRPSGHPYSSGRTSPIRSR